MNNRLFDQIDRYLSDPQENSEHLLDTFDYIWSYLFYSCQFSKHFLFQTNLCREYITLNNLIVDKIDDILMKLFEKFSYSASFPDAKTFEISSSLLLPAKGQMETHKPYSMYSIFILECWFNVLMDYILSVLKKGVTFQARKSAKQLAAGADSTENLQKPVDLSLCKKLISLVQKCIEAYLNVSCSHVAQLSPGEHNKRNPEPIRHLAEANESREKNQAEVNENTRVFLSSFLGDSLRLAKISILFCGPTPKTQKSFESYFNTLILFYTFWYIN